MGAAGRTRQAHSDYNRGHVRSTHEFRKAANIKRRRFMGRAACFGSCLIRAWLVGAIGQLPRAQESSINGETGIALTPPGWYPDPTGSGRQNVLTATGAAWRRRRRRRKRVQIAAGVAFIVIGSLSCSSRSEDAEAVTTRLRVHRQAQAEPPAVLPRCRRLRPSQRLRRPSRPDRQCGTASASSVCST